ncbi:hypothetical protein WA026_005131 [Henosepilachna vigintioctopunctata]|uniref:Uncharacterized protein n=1 Tax=Henosepilachna vigintioctopunctata TaxID=420089 RepID=A0AAW1UWG4_9CUCU
MDPFNWLANILSSLFDESLHFNSRFVDLTGNSRGYTTTNNVPYIQCVTPLLQLLSKGFDINTTTKCGITALHLVCIDGYKECISLLLRYKPSMNVSHKWLGTPLHIFLKDDLRDQRILKKMLDAGADPNMKDPSGNAALHIEVLRTSPEKQKKFIQLLIKYKADINMRNENGWTPLHLAIREGYEDVVYNLLRKGADINIKDNNGTTQMKTAFSYRFQNPTMLTHLGKHLILQHGRNIPVDVDDLEQLCEIDHLRKYKIRCDEEVSTLKRTTVCTDSYVTYFDILIASPDKMAKYVQNLDIVKSLENFDKNKFLYGNRIIRNFKQGMRRREAIGKIEPFCRDIFPPLPEVCINKITEYLKYEDIEPLR